MKEGRLSELLPAPAQTNGSRKSSTPLEVGGSVTATSFIGDGSQLTNLPIPQINDSNLVHKTGNETLNGTKTFTANTYFRQMLVVGDGIVPPISGAYGTFTSAASNAGFTINRDNLAAYASLDFLQGGSFTTGWSVQLQPNAQDLAFVNRAVSGPTSNQLVLWQNGKTSIGGAVPTQALTVAGKVQADGYIGDGSQLTNLPIPQIDDSNLVHRTGDETVAGKKTFTDFTAFNGSVAASRYDLIAGATTSLSDGQLAVTGSNYVGTYKVSAGKLTLENHTVNASTQLEMSDNGAKLTFSDGAANVLDTVTISANKLAFSEPDSSLVLVGPSASRLVTIAVNTARNITVNGTPVVLQDQVVQTTGISTTQVMSQAATTVAAGLRPVANYTDSFYNNPTDSGKLVIFNRPTGCEFSIYDEVNSSSLVGNHFYVQQKGAGTVTIVPRKAVGPLPTVTAIGCRLQTEYPGHILHVQKVASDQWQVRSVIGIQAVDGVFSTATGDVSTRPTEAVKSAVKAAVPASWTNGELQGTQPAGSVRNTKFVDAAYRYEFMPGMNDTNGTTLVWVRTIKG